MTVPKGPLEHFFLQMTLPPGPSGPFWRQAPLATLRRRFCSFKENKQQALPRKQNSEDPDGTSSFQPARHPQPQTPTKPQQDVAPLDRHCPGSTSLASWPQSPVVLFWSPHKPGKSLCPAPRGHRSCCQKYKCPRTKGSRLEGTMEIITEENEARGCAGPCPKS